MSNLNFHLISFFHFRFEKLTMTNSYFRFEMLAVFNGGSLAALSRKLFTFLACLMYYFFFFYQGFLSRTLTTHRTAGEGRGPSYSTLQLPPAYEHSDIYLQLCTWDDYHMFLIATLVFTRLLLDEIYHLIELLFDWLMM